MIDRFCALATMVISLKVFLIRSLKLISLIKLKVLQNLGLSLAKPVICLAPAAEYGPAKRWPTAHFAKLSSQLQTARVSNLANGFC